jgi:hypothetical protein
MKILITTNTFGKYDRQNLCIESLKKLKKEFPDNVNIIDVQFEDESKDFVNHYDLDVKFNLTRSSLDVVPNATKNKKLPFVNDLFKISCDYAEDYFVFTNSDVIVNANLIRYILNNSPACFACSRLDIQPINNLSELKENIKLVRWEIAGFDTFVFKKSWFLQYQHLFNDYLLGRPEFDHIYAGIMKCYGDNTPFGNQYPPFCFHVHHGLDSVMNDNPERQFNVNMMKDNPFDTLVSRLVFYNLKTNLIRRSPWGAFLYPEPNEQDREINFFKEFILTAPPKLV